MAFEKTSCIIWLKFEGGGTGIGVAFLLLLDDASVRFITAGVVIIAGV